VTKGKYDQSNNYGLETMNQNHNLRDKKRANMTLGKTSAIVFTVAAIIPLTLLVNVSNASSETSQDSGWMMLRPFELEEIYPVEGMYDMHFGHRSGASFSENPDSPFYLATVLCQETLFHNPEGAEIGEVGICELTGPEGDTAFLRFLYWFEDGMPVDLVFIGGTGKWRYIKGSGKVLEELDHRKDDHHNLHAKVLYKLGGD
jgi:hypothetical protein